MESNLKFPKKKYDNIFQTYENWGDAVGRLIIDQSFIKIREKESTRLSIKLQRMFSGLILRAKQIFLFLFIFFLKTSCRTTDKKCRGITAFGLLVPLSLDGDALDCGWMLHPPLCEHMENTFQKNFRQNNEWTYIFKDFFFNKERVFAEGLMLTPVTKCRNTHLQNLSQFSQPQKLIYRVWKCCSSFPTGWDGILPGLCHSWLCCQGIFQASWLFFLSALHGCISQLEKRSQTRFFINLEWTWT